MCLMTDAIIRRLCSQMCSSFWRQPASTARSASDAHNGRPETAYGLRSSKRPPESARPRRGERPAGRPSIPRPVNTGAVLRPVAGTCRPPRRREWNHASPPPQTLTRLTCPHFLFFSRRAAFAAPQQISNSAAASSASRTAPAAAAPTRRAA